MPDTSNTQTPASGPPSANPPASGVTALEPTRAKPPRPTRAKPRLRAKALEAILDGVRSGDTITGACGAAGVSRRTYYDALARHPELRAELDRALDASTTALIDEALRRGLTGYDEPVFQQGRQVGVVRRYSDKLLLALLASRDPRFRSDSTAVTVTNTIATGEGVIASLRDKLDAIASRRDKLVELFESRLRDRPVAPATQPRLPVNNDSETLSG